MVKDNNRLQHMSVAMPEGKAVAIMQQMSEIISVLIFFGGCIVLMGWALDIAALKSVLPGLVTMKANTALCFVLIGLALWCLQMKRADHVWSRLTAELCVFVLLSIGLVTMCEYAFQWTPGIDQLLFQDSASAVLTSSPGRMALNTAINFVLIALAFLFSSRKRVRLDHVAQSLTLFVVYTSLLALVGYFYGAAPLYFGQKFSTAMAFHTAVFFVLSAFGIFFLRSERGFMAQVTSDLMGGNILRRILPVAILVPISMGFFEIFAQRITLFSNEFGVSLVAMGNLSFVVLYIYFLGRLLNYSDAGRKGQEDSTAAAKEYLEKIINAVADPIFVKDQEHRWVLYNSAFLAFIGRKAGELQGKSDYDFFPREQADIFWKKDEEVFFGGKEIINEEFFTDGKGTLRTIITKKTLYEDPSGRKYIVGIIQDITDRKVVEEALKASEVRHREMFGRMRSGVAVYEAKKDGEDFILRDFNPEAERTNQVKREDILGRSVLDVFPNVRDTGIFNVFQRVWKTGISENYPAVFYKDERIARWFENDVYKLPSGEIVAIFNDVTEQKMAGEEVRKRIKEMEILYKVSMGREERILELKKKVMELELKLGT